MAAEAEASMVAADLMAAVSMAVAGLMAARGLLVEEVAMRAASAVNQELVVSERVAVPTAGSLHRAA